MAFGLLEAMALASMFGFGNRGGGGGGWQPPPGGGGGGGGGGLPPPGGGGWAPPGGETGQACEPPPAPWGPCSPVTSDQVSTARSLMSQLWATGCGSTIVQKTGDRVVMYQANYVAPGKKGVVAYCMPADVEQQMPPGWEENLPGSDWQAQNNAKGAQHAADAAAAAANALGNLADTTGDPFHEAAADDAAGWADDAQDYADDAANAAGFGGGDSGGMFDTWDGGGGGGSTDPGDWGTQYADPGGGDGGGDFGAFDEGGDWGADPGGGGDWGGGEDLFSSYDG